jgi:hypothetical protein
MREGRENFWFGFPGLWLLAQPYPGLSLFRSDGASGQPRCARKIEEEETDMTSPMQRGNGAFKSNSIFKEAGIRLAARNV